MTNNTIMTAKNTFAEGLIMDIAPDNTQANFLTSALNATLLTFNGNELSLQNDMGNGRIETARLPEGYIPLGTCEFGDIIYIVSYNPLTNKSQIGCFPSPERNISSDEISDIIITINNTDFQNVDNFGNPTGKLKNTSIRKILLDKHPLNPGDKFIIYSESEINKQDNLITNLNNPEHATTYQPRLVNMRVIAIDDSNKATYIDSDIKWYDNSYFILSNKNNNEIQGSKDLDNYRTLVSSAYSIFQSKNSGKLALLAELEQINGFNCAYSVNTKVSDTLLGQETTYTINLHTSWLTSNFNINPSGYTIIESGWVGTNGGEYTTYDKDTFKPIKNKLKDFIKRDLNNQDYMYSRTYHQEASGSYSDFLSVKKASEHKCSYYKLINDDKNNPMIGWGLIPGSTEESNINDINTSEALKELLPNLMEVTRITPVIDINGKEIRKNDATLFYLNLDKIEKVNGQIYGYTYGINKKLYKTKKVFISDDVVNNYFKKDITIPIKQTLTVPTTIEMSDGGKYNVDLQNLVYKIKVAPFMSYGILEQYIVELLIDFSKVGKQDISLSDWRYYNDTNVCQLIYGLNINLSNNQKVKEVSIDFYDNQGLSARYVTNNKSAYSGVFTEHLGLNGTNVNYKLSNINSNNELIYHAGNRATDANSDNLVHWEGFIDTPKKYDPNKHIDNIFINDSGTLYSNFLYAAIITVRYGIPDGIGGFLTDEMWVAKRWLWTNFMYNNYCFESFTKDFDILPLQLYVTGQYTLTSTDKYQVNAFDYYNTEAINSYNPSFIPGTNYDKQVPQLSLGASVMSINQDGKQSNNLNIKFNIGLQDSYNTLFLDPTTKQDSSNIDYDLYLGRAKITTSDYKIITENGEDFNFEQLKPKITESKTGIIKADNTEGIGPNLLEKLGITSTTSKKYPELWENADYYKDQFNITMNNANISQESYIDPATGENFKYECKKHIDNYEELSKKGVNLTLSGIHFNKVCFNKTKEITGKFPVVQPIAKTKANRDKLGISFQKKGKNVDTQELPLNDPKSINQDLGPKIDLFYFNKVLAINTGGKKNGAMNLRYYSSFDHSTIRDQCIEIGNSRLVSATSDRWIQGIDHFKFESPLVLCLWTDTGDNRRLRQDGTELVMNIEGSEDCRLSINQTTDTSVSDTFQLGIYNPGKGFYLLNDFIVKPEIKFTFIPLKHRSSQQLSGMCTNLYIDPNFILESQDTNTKQVLDKYRTVRNPKSNATREYLSLGNLVISVLSNIYYQSKTLKEYSYNRIYNLCSNQDLFETWSKHLTLKINIPTNVSSFNSRICFNNGTSLEAYLNYLNNKISNTEKINSNSSNKNINSQLIAREQFIDFQYNVQSQYTIKDKYLKNKEIQTLIYPIDSNKYIPSSMTYKNILYTSNLMNKDNFELIPLTKDFTYEIVKDWNFTNDGDILQITHSNDFIKVPNLGNLITYDSDNFFKINNYTNSTNICRLGSSENGKDDSYYTLPMEATFTGANYGLRKG